ncbi:HAD family hydrolase [Streptomyces sp. NPDC090119]|uniref:HAD family hydrolase n=1 Tax=Streptomyces sp. NPDC090119 TaxID=3365951 RepID=UPI003817D2B7
MTAVLFDFSGTLCRAESTESWLRAALAVTGTTLSEPRFRSVANALDEVGALSGGAEPSSVPEELAGAWAERDRDAAAHRAAYTGLARQVPLPVDDLYDALYDRHMAPAAWAPYPDALPVLQELRERGVAVGIVSNIGWDLRPVFREHGLDPYVDAYVLSYEHGMRKPDAGLFALACAELGVEPRRTLMVGDDRAKDGGAAAIGCRVHFVDHLPVDARPDALLPVLDLLPKTRLPSA